MRKTAWMLAGAIALVATPVVAADADDATPSDHVPWARWQGRLSLGTTTSSAARLGADAPSAKLSSASVIGDYYFGRSLAGIGQPGGFRASSGLISGPRGALSIGQPSLNAGNAFSIDSRSFGQPATLPYSPEAPTDTATMPYVGVGYTGLSMRGGWSFSADLGLVAQSPGNAMRLGRVINGGQSLDDMVRDMRLAPMLQFGVSYAF